MSKLYEKALACPRLELKVIETDAMWGEDLVAARIRLDEDWSISRISHFTY
jgi:hypothetical protein